MLNQDLQQQLRHYSKIVTGVRHLQRLGWSKWVAPTQRTQLRQQFLGRTPPIRRPAAGLGGLCHVRRQR